MSFTKLFWQSYSSHPILIGIKALSGWGGLHVPMTPRAKLAGSCTPVRATLATQVKGYEPDKE